MELSGEDLSCYLHNIRSGGLWKCMYDNQLANKAYFSDITVKNIFQSFTHKMAAKANWHWNYVTVTLLYTPKEFFVAVARCETSRDRGPRVTGAVNCLLCTQGKLKEITVARMSEFVIKDSRLPMLLDRYTLSTSVGRRFLPARRYASAGTSYGPVPVSVCLSVCLLCLCLSVTSRCSIKRDKRINLLFGMEASFDQSYTVFF